MYLGEKFLNSLTKILFTYLVMFKFLYTAVNQLESSKLKENAKDQKKNPINLHVCMFARESELDQQHLY